MALVNDPVFAQEPKNSGITFGAASESTQMDPATVAPTTLLTAGADGAIVTSVEVWSEVTTTDEKFVLWVQPGGTGNWYVVRQGLLGAYTMAATTAQTPLKLVDQGDETNVLRLSGGTKLGVTHHVDQQSMVTAQWTEL